MLNRGVLLCVAPPPYSVGPPQHWPGEALSTTTVSDSDVKKPEHLRISDVRTNPHYNGYTPRKGMISWMKSGRICSHLRAT